MLGAHLAAEDQDVGSFWYFLCCLPERSAVVFLVDGCVGCLEGKGVFRWS